MIDVKTLVSSAFSFNGSNGLPAGPDVTGCVMTNEFVGSDSAQGLPFTMNFPVSGFKVFMVMLYAGRSRLLAESMAGR